MHPKTAAALAELEQSLIEADRLQRRLIRLAQYRPPLYWELAPGTVRLAQQLAGHLQQEKEQLLSAQQALGGGEAL